MVIQLKGSLLSDAEVEHLVTRVFFKAIELLGGLNKLTEYRTLTWLPSLARASYAVVLKEEYMKTDEEIAQKVGLTKNTVRNILRADPQLALQKIKALEELVHEEARELKVHTAGGIAKLAYKEIKEGHEAQTLIYYCSLIATDLVRALDIPWAYSILKRSKGVKYPITGPDELMEKLRGLTIKGLAVEEILDSIPYPIKSPAMLIHEIKEYLKLKEKS